MTTDLSKITAIIRGRAQGKSCNLVAAELKLSSATVWKYDRRFVATSLSYAELQKMDPDEVLRLLRPNKRQQLNYAEPDWPRIYHDVHSGKATRKELWLAYLAENSSGSLNLLSYSSFCRNYQQFKDCLPADLKEFSATFQHAPGEVMEIDYSGSGHRVGITNPVTGEFHEAQIFCASLPCSGLCYCQATPRQTLDDWTDGTVGAFTYFGGVTAYTDMDNTTAFVKMASKYAPEVSPALKSLCEYYKTEPFPVRPHSPRDKATVEGCVGIIQTHCLSKLTGRQFFSYEELNKALLELVDELNNAPFSDKFKGESRRALFEEKERDFLLPLPPEPYEKSMIIKTLKVRKEGDVRFNGHRYSVPYREVGNTVRLLIFPHRNKLRITDMRGTFLAEHEMKPADGGFSQKREHLPANVQFVLQSVEERVACISKAGPSAAEAAKRVSEGLKTRVADKRLQGLQSYQRKLGNSTFEDCCAKAVEAGAHTYTEVVSYLMAAAGEKRTTVRLKRGNELDLPRKGKNVRGAQAYACQSPKTTDEEK